MLTNKTMVDFAQLELRRDPGFARFCEERLPGLRSMLPLPTYLVDCLAIEVVKGMPLAQLLLDAYNNQAEEPQWLRAKRAAAR